MGISLQPTLTAPTPATPASPANSTNAPGSAEGQAFKDVYVGKMAKPAQADHAKASAGKSGESAGEDRQAAPDEATAVDPASLLLQLANAARPGKAEDSRPGEQADSEDDRDADDLIAQSSDPLLTGTTAAAENVSSKQPASQDKDSSANLLANSDLAAQMAQLLQHAATHPQHQDATPPETAGEISGQGELHSALASANRSDEAAILAATTGENIGKIDNPAAFRELLNTAAAANQGSTPAHQEVATPLGHARWNQDFSEKVVWFARNEVQSAQLDINPPHLGPMQISLQVSGDQVSANFTSPHAEVRQAIEDAMPKLRDMLASAGINLGDANVGSQWARQQQGASEQAFSNGARFSGEPAILPGNTGNAGIVGVAQPLHRGRGLVDLFA